MFLTKKAPAASSPEARMNSAHSLALGAVQSFRDAADDLETAAAALAEIEEEATAEAARHVSIANDAIRAQAEHLATAEKIRDLVGG